MDHDDLKRFLIEIIEEEFSPKPCEISSRWQGGVLVLKPGNDTQAKDIPLDVFFKKILTVRDSLRVLEQKINTNSTLTQEEKTNFQAYITKAYGSLTTFNVLFKEDRDRFHGSSKRRNSDDSPMTMAEAKKKLGLNQY